MSTTEIGALIVSLRSESAQFRSEMDKARGSVKGVGDHAVLSSRSLARFGAIAAESVAPGLQGSRLAMEGFINTLIRAEGLLGTVAKGIGLVAAGFAGFALGNIIRNFQELREQGFGYVEALKLAVGESKSYEDAVKDDVKQQKDFSDSMAKSRVTSQGLSKELAELTGDYMALLQIADAERRARIQTLPLNQRAAEQAKADAIFRLETAKKQKELDDAAIERQKKILELRQQEKEAAAGKGGKAGAAELLGLPETSLIRGNREIDEFIDNIEKLATEIVNLAREGAPASALFNEISSAQDLVDKGITRLREKFADAPQLFQRVVDVQNQIGSGGFRKALDASVKSIQNLETGTKPVVEEMTDLAFLMQDDFPTAAATVNSSLVIVTGNVLALAQAFNMARINLRALIGAQSAAAIPTAPGNFPAEALP